MRRSTAACWAGADDDDVPIGLLHGAPLQTVEHQPSLCESRLAGILSVLQSDNQSIRSS